MRLRWPVLFLILVVLVSSIHTQPVQAARGIPGSAEFGFGARLNLYGSQFDQALQLAGTLRLDWLTIDLAWASLMPDPTVAIDFTRLDQAMQTAAQNQTAVMLSITQPPAWALTSQGPNPNLAAVFVQMLAARYAGTLQAVEFFPSANTLTGWGAAPDPAAYWNAFSSVRSKLQESGISLEWIAGGLEITKNSSSGSMDELDFLRGLYQAGAAGNLPVVSLRYSEITGQPSDPTQDSEKRLLRRYEAIRQVMTDNNQGNCLLWITHLSVPDGTINSGETSTKDPNQQSNWLTQAATQLRAQLYIGMVVFADLNAVDSSQPTFKGANLSAGGHPFAKTLREIIQYNDPGDLGNPPGRAKNGAFTKPRS
ncbi:hypothetical protein LARV_02828 [Longilinea arvoryzae]|uniref:Glycoside hydrolase family 42 N-terminal domain-containing protein n=1 Tax=Longilinea arvoryzae TaxID=360412 RepID=A0A0S7BL25_9CHLR|nr:hypothetical protein [Longilinea arvoryzae]GAP15048.1 hypothetical protein LARV_02828 [Longilinea arvoryzae]